MRGLPRSRYDPPLEETTLSPFSKSAFAFRCSLPLLFACAACTGLHSPRTAVDVVRQKDSTVEWNAQSLLEADLDQDGRADYALLGSRKDRVVVGIVHGPLAAGTPVWTLEFPWKGGGEDALCSPDAKIAVEPLGDEAKTRRRGGQGVGLNLHDDKCDAFHIFWNPEKKKFEWWRL
jgi:hypothetical protein